MSSGRPCRQAARPRKRRPRLAWALLPAATGTLTLVPRPLPAHRAPAAAVAATGARGGAAGPGAGGAGLAEELVESQSLRLTEPATGTDVQLLGCTHFHPLSAWCAGRSAEDLLSGGRLGAVVLEICPGRWERALQRHPEGSPWRAVMDNEMQAAAEPALLAGVPVHLGDSSAEQADTALVSLMRATAEEMLDPLGGGWQSIWEDVGGSRSPFRRMLARPPTAAAPAPEEGTEEAPGTVQSLLFLLGVPWAVVRNLIVILLEATQSAVSFVLALAVFAPALLLAGRSAAAAVGLVLAPAFQAWGWLLVLPPCLLLWRVLPVALLQQRDAVLADSVRAACAEHGGPGRTVLAVLGAAHCQGVRRQLLAGLGSPSVEEAPRGGDE